MKTCAQCSQKPTYHDRQPRQNLYGRVEFLDGCDNLSEIREAGILLRQDIVRIFSTKNTVKKR